MRMLPIGHIYLQIESLGDDPEYLIGWAVRCLEHGCDVSSIVELAGYTKPVNRHDLMQTLKSLCKDLNVDLRDPHRNLVSYISETAQRYLANDLTLDECRSSIWWASGRMDGIDHGLV